MSDTAPELPAALAGHLIAPDVQWCWWTRPRATRIADTVWFGGLDSHGQMLALSYGLRSRETKRFALAQFEDDDHNNAALVAVRNKPLIAFYARHSEDNLLRYRLSRRPLDLSEWEVEQALEFDGVTTYAEVHPVGSALHVFTRTGEIGWSYRHSPDWGLSWDSGHDFLRLDTDQQVYMATVLLRDRRTLRMAVSGHPKEYEQKPLHDVWAAVIDLETGAVRNPVGGETIANLRTGENLPLDYRALELVHRTQRDRTANIMDVGDGPQFEVAWTSKLKDDHSNRGARYHVATLGEGGWRVDDVVLTGDIFGYIHAGFYVGGIGFPDHTPGGVAYLTREERGLWALEKRTRQADGSWAPDVLLGPTATRLTRPWALTDPAENLGVVALALERYGDSYYGTLSHLVGAPG